MIPEIQRSFSKILISLAVTTTLFSCTTAHTNFAAMSESELLAYNRDKPVMKQIYCERNKRSTDSHIRRTECRSVEDWVYHNFRAQMALDTISTHRHSY